MRADVRRNRAALLDAAGEIFVEQGVEAPLDAIAKHAQLGVATLYRHFPDRPALIKAVAIRSFAVVADLAKRVVAPDEEPQRDPGVDSSSGHLEMFTTTVARLRLGAFMPSLLPALAALGPDEELEMALAEMIAAVEALVVACQRAGELRGDVTGEDLLLVLAVTSRPLEGLPSEFSSMAVPRLVALAVEGLRPRADARSLPEATVQLTPPDAFIGASAPKP